MRNLRKVKWERTYQVMRQGAEDARPVLHTIHRIVYEDGFVVAVGGVNYADAIATAYKRAYETVTR